MSADLFWFDDEQWSKVEPHLPTNQSGPATFGPVRRR
jgi:hypothetical protein